MEDTRWFGGAFQKFARGHFTALFFVAAVVLFFIVLAAIALSMPASRSHMSASFTVVKGESLADVADHLKRERFIRSKLLFEGWGRLSGISTLIQAGTYTLNTSMNVVTVASVLSESVSPDELTITIPEGWTIKDMADFFQTRGVFSASAFLIAAQKDYTHEFPFLRDAYAARSRGYYLEGYLFPDTYRIFKDASPDDVIQKMLSRFNQQLSSSMRNDMLIRKKTLDEIVIMASIIEREVRSSDEKAMVSGILWKRLNAGIALQADATIVYIKTGGRSRIGVDAISRDDVKTASPYNTYLHRGLPPGPISNPGIESIAAAIYPQASPYLYYLSAPDGTTVFSRTLEEHNANKAKYLR